MLSLALDRLATVALIVALLPLTACQASGGSRPPAEPIAPQAVATPAGPDPDPSPPPSVAAPPPAPAQPAAPVTIEIGFVGLPSGTYPVHLHSACNGSQAFHIAVVASLLIGNGGTGAIDISTADTGRGWCLIVYTNASLSRVLTTRPV